MLDEETTDDTTEINWECHDGTDQSRISIRGIAEKPPPLPAESRALRQRRELREQLVREHIGDADPRRSLLARLLKSFFRRDSR